MWLSLAETFAERNTVLPGLILLAGGDELDVGYLTSIMIGVPLISQLLFASYLTPKKFKKPFLLSGIYLRVFAFIGLALSIMMLENMGTSEFILVIFLWMVLFSVSGAFAGVSYTDIVGKSFTSETRKRFFVTKQIITSTGILISAFLVKELLIAVEYPKNYSFSFFIAAALLFIASFGFLFLKEKASIIRNNYSKISDVLKSIPSEIKSNKNLGYFIIISNLIGVTFTLIPFYIAYSKTIFDISEEVIGLFLIAQLMGMILSNFIWRYFIRKYSFKGMLKATIILLASIPPVVLIIASMNSVTMFTLVFVIVGAAISAQKITMEGVLIEISDESNRPIYVGIFGSLNVTSAFLPILSGNLFGVIGYSYVFIIWSFITFSALFFVNKMKCPIDVNAIKVDN